jgi:polysaccharide biosynthesis/export protein
LKNSRFDNYPKQASMLRLAGILLASWIILTITSCSNVKNLQYLQGSFDTASLSKLSYADPVIQKGDLLAITILSDDPQATAAVTNQMQPISLSTVQLPTNGVNSGINTNSGAATPGFLVDQDGNIQLYKLGSMRAEGFTKKQLADTLAQRYVSMGLLKNPYAEVRFMNYKVTLVGEVNKPGTYSFPTDRISTFEALGLAGDITVYGRRDNVLVVREVNGKREFGRLDLSKPNAFLSPYYYLQQNDLVIVDVAKNKGVVNDQTTVRNITVAASILSTIAIFLNIFRR